MDVPAVVTQPVERRVSRNGALLVASFGALLAFLDATIVNVAFPSIRVSFPGSSIETLSWVLTAYNIVGAALLVPASLALVVEAFPAAQRARAVGLWGAAAAAAAGLGPPLGGALVEIYNWRLAFLINLPLGVLAIALGRRFLVESRAPGRRTLPDLRGALLLGISIALLTLGIVQG